jgi:hypothetical protein
MKTVGQLVKELQELDQDLPVVLSSDPEGNGFHFLSEVGAPYYVDQHDLRQGYYIDGIVGEQDLEDEDEDYDRDGYGAVVVLWP